MRPLIALHDIIQMTLEEYYAAFATRFNQPSERLFVDEFLYPLLGENISEVLPQHPFLDRTGRSRRIDFACTSGLRPIALEIDGETYHGEGIIPNELFDDSLFRQNEILRAGYALVRFSYSQLQSPSWRNLVRDTLRDTFRENAPHLLNVISVNPNEAQREALGAIEFYRRTGVKRGVVVLPTGTGKTILSALDSLKVGGRVAFIVHRLDILKQSVDAFKSVWGSALKVGYLTGEITQDTHNCDVLFASKDSLRQPQHLASFPRDWFDYVIVDEVHHGQSPSYQSILEWFAPKFLLGITATPDRTDRKDILELFDYHKLYELPLQDAIEKGYLVPYTYYGLTDNIDYSRIKFNGNRYRVDDLERLLIIPDRNQAILSEYIEKGQGDKAVGFCVSIVHAERMAEYFNENGISAVAIHSGTQDRDQLIADFRNNKYQCAFTVDLFNEGIDFPNLRVLLFLRPTESKTVFFQQLGRGLRLCSGKDRVRVLDFIGNYNRANQIRKYLAKATKRQGGDGPDRKKVEYSYSAGCEVHFTAEVEEILNKQDVDEAGIDQKDLEEAYFELAERLGHKPSRADIDAEGAYKSRFYSEHWGSWAKFLRSIGEYTEASYHYPQGTHLGHILSILWTFGLPNRGGTHFEDKFIALEGGLAPDRVGNYQRQVKYKLQAAMELRILEDDRASSAAGYVPTLTALGRELLDLLAPELGALDLRFPISEGVPSSRMAESEAFYNEFVLRMSNSSVARREAIFAIFLGMPAVRQMLCYLYKVARTTVVSKEQIYSQFFQAPFVKQFCDREGIDEATEEASRHRCPFLLNILAALGIITISRSEVRVDKLLLFTDLVKATETENEQLAMARLIAAFDASKARTGTQLSDVDISILRESLGKSFLTDEYHLSDVELFQVKNG